jgi:acyl transferase domain-containing protein
VLARHLILPVRFADAIRTLALTGFETFVECGPLRGLARTIDATTAMLDRGEAGPAGARLGEPVPELALILIPTDMRRRE